MAYLKPFSPEDRALPGGYQSVRVQARIKQLSGCQDDCRSAPSVQPSAFLFPAWQASDLPLFGTVVQKNGDVFVLLDARSNCLFESVARSFLHNLFFASDGILCGSDHVLANCTQARPSRWVLVDSM